LDFIAVIFFTEQGDQPCVQPPPPNLVDESVGRIHCCWLHWVFFHSLPRLAGWGWRYSNAPSHGEIVHLVSWYGKIRKCILNSLGITEGHCESIDVDRVIILKWMKGMECGCVWIFSIWH
jgi:hypothetical protein